MAFLDVPYNVRVRSIGGRGRVKRAEFAFASGEMTPPEYVEFLGDALGSHPCLARWRRSFRVLRLAARD
jgi:hypothetical protein